MNLIIIAALSENRVIGRNGTVPWNIPEDMQRFKRLTLGHTVLMGRGTYETLSEPLTNRRNVVLTSRPLPGVETYGSIGDAIRGLKNNEEVYLIGGGQVFAELLTSASRLMLTIVHQYIEGDTYFPPYEHLIGPLFKLTSAEHHDGFSFMDYARVEQVDGQFVPLGHRCWATHAPSWHWPPLMQKDPFPHGALLLA